MPAFSGTSQGNPILFHTHGDPSISRGHICPLLDTQQNIENMYIWGKLNGYAFDGSPNFQSSNDNTPTSPGILVFRALTQSTVALATTSALSSSHSHSRWPSRRRQNTISLWPPELAPVH